MIALNDDYIPDTGFEFLLQNNIGIVVLLIALMFLIYQNGKNLYKNAQKYLKRERESKYHNYYMFAVCKSVICYFNILSLFTLIFQIVNIDINYVKNNFYIDFYFTPDIGEYSYSYSE